MLQLITKNEWKTSQWGGGETHEVYLYPVTGNYQERNFNARISMATTNDASKSAFTSLPGVERFISLLEGDMHLFFEGRYDRVMQPYDIVNFQGDWSVYTMGKYADFNLMIKGGTGHLHFSEANGETLIQAKGKVDRLFLFVLSGEVTVENYLLHPQDLLVTDQEDLLALATDARFFYGYFTINEQ